MGTDKSQLFSSTCGRKFERELLYPLSHICFEKGVKKFRIRSSRWMDNFWHRSADDSNRKALEFIDYRRKSNEISEFPSEIIIHLNT